MKKFYVLQHIDCEPLGIWEEELKRWYARYEYIRVWEGVSMPAVEDTLAAIVLGGPMSANDADNYPFMHREIKYLRQLVDQNIHVLGVCLGAQMLASALGATVSNGPRAEIGYSTVTLNHAGTQDALMLAFPRELPVFQWHEQGFYLPKGAECLAGTEDYPNQAFRYKNAWGFQFHLEVTPEMVGEFGRQYADMLARIPQLTMVKLMEQAQVKGHMVTLYGRQVIRRFWDSVTAVD
ncbi:type 1 glutamine amidotransferase [candidate division FCPU426 bacterium]|nr:type 1 glutamine amidotransferase [candidate division FCPU426 bacterium]